jgi:hypothetical protein
MIHPLFNEATKTTHLGQSLFLSFTRRSFLRNRHKTVLKLTALGFVCVFGGKIVTMNGEGCEVKEKMVYMWGYLPGALPQRTPLLTPVLVRVPASSGGYNWKDVSGGGCGFAMAISGILPFSINLLSLNFFFFYFVLLCSFTV